MQQMTAEDLTISNNLLEKYDMKGWSPAYISTQDHPCSLTLLPFELVGDEVVTLIKEAPSKSLDYPTYDGVKWVEGGKQTQAQILAKIQDEQESLNKKLESSANKDAANDKSSELLRGDVKQLSHSITMLTALVTQQMGARNVPTVPGTTTTDSKDGDK